MFFFAFQSISQPAVHIRQYGGFLVGSYFIFKWCSYGRLLCQRHIIENHSKLTEQINLHSGSAIVQSEETHHVTPRLWFITMTNGHWSWFMTHTLASSGIHTGYSQSTIKRMVRSNWFFLSFEALSIGTQVCIPRLHWNDTFSDFLTTLVWRNSKSSNITLKWLHLCKVSLGVKLLL